MKIGQSDANTLLVGMTDALQGATVGDFQTFDFPKGWEKNATGILSDDLQKSLSKHLDGSSLESFITNYLRVIQVQSGTELPKAGTPIRRVRCFSDPLATARDLVKSLGELPYNYRMVVRASAELADRINRSDIDLRLSQQLRLISGANIPDTFKLKHDIEGVDAYIRRGMFEPGKPFEVSPTGLYLEYRTSGYISSRGSSRTISEFYDEVRAFYGSCIASGIIATFDHLKYNFTPILAVNAIKDGEETFAHVERAEDDIVRCAGLATTPATDEKIADGSDLSVIIAPILSVFSSQISNRLKTASIWILRAHLSKRPLDKVLESTIAMEVLLGDRDTSDRVGLSKLMANRCAYALGKSNEERGQIIEFFVKFYRLRSEIVHSGRTVLLPEERKIVSEGLSLATRMLRHEVAIA
jgi:hypothetical protein